MLLTLRDLADINQSKTERLINGNPYTSEKQSHLKLITTQRFAGLSVQEIRESDPEIDNYLTQIENLEPGFFQQENLEIDLPISTRIEVNRVDYYVQVPCCITDTGQTITLWEWGIRSPDISWSDKIKLWVATEYLRARVAMEQECTLSPKSLPALHFRQRQSGAITRIPMAYPLVYSSRSHQLAFMASVVAKPAVLRQQ